MSRRSHHRRSPLAHGLGALALAALAVACTGATDGAGKGADVTGSWRYSATQSTANVSLDGTLTIGSQQGTTVGGQLEAQETDPSGAVRNRVGPVTGRVVDSTTLDLDVFLEPVSRRHVGTLRGDSVAGTWAQTSGSGTLTGSFVLRRMRAR